jgi:hypothetical protein
MELFVPAAVATKHELNAAASPIPMVPSRSSSGPRDGGAAAWRNNQFHTLARRILWKSSSSPWPEGPQLGEGAWRGSGGAAAVTMARTVRGQWRQRWFVLAMLRYVHVKCSTKCLAASEGGKLTLTKMRLLHHGMPGNQTQLYTV